MTAALDPIMGDAGFRDLSFSAPAATGGGGGVAGTTVDAIPVSGGGEGTVPPPEAQHVGDASAGSPGDPADAGEAGGAAGAAGGAGGGDGNSLPFTGFVPGVVVAVGSALTASGVALRRALRRRDG